MIQLRLFLITGPKGPYVIESSVSGALIMLVLMDLVELKQIMVQTKVVHSLHLIQLSLLMVQTDNYH